MVKLVTANRWGNRVELHFPNEHKAKQYARLLVARGVKVKGIVLAR